MQLNQKITQQRSAPRVGLDLRATEDGFKAHYGRGTGRYVTELVEHLLRASVNGAKFQPQFVPASTVALGASKIEQKLYQLVPLGRNTIEQQLLLPRRIAQQGVDLFHFFSHVDAPSRCSVPYVVTVLDLIPLKFPELYSADKPNWRFKFARFLELQAIRRANGIIAISEATKSDLVEMLGVAPEKIVVTPLAVSRNFVARELQKSTWESDLSLLRQKVGLPTDRPVLLYVGGIDARKNVTFLLEIFNEVLRNSKNSSKPILVMVGRYETDNNYPRLISDIRRLELGDDVKLMGFVSESKLVQVYHAATAMLFPSLYEGFGLPVLEAMACGVPVVALRNSCIPEVTAKSAVLLDDEDKSKWASSILQILSSTDRQDELAQLGRSRALHFSWARTASLTVDAYEYFLQNLLS